MFSLFIGFKGGGFLSAAHSLCFWLRRDNPASGYFALPQVLMVGHSARARLQQVVRAALPTMARCFGLPVALHFTATVSVPLTAGIWPAAARGDKAG
jgi:hypothetical protein